MKTLHAIIESTENNYSAYIKEIDGIVATGGTIGEIKAKLTEVLSDYAESCKELGCEVPDVLVSEYTLSFKMDVKSLLTLYNGIFTKSGLERITGINQKQLWHYANGKSTPRKAQVQKIENALHRLGNELIAVSL